MNILYLHGANMTSRSFSMFDDALKGSSFCPEYDINNGLAANVKDIASQAKGFFGDESFNIISHSMGGLIALALYENQLNINKIVTLSTPFGGSVASTHLKWFFPLHVLFTDTCSESNYLKGLRLQNIDIPMLSFVSTKGHNPMKYSPNDGVVSLASQQMLAHTKYVFIELNHYEILMCPYVIERTQLFLN